MDAASSFAVWFLAAFFGLAVGVALIVGSIFLGERIARDKLPALWYAIFMAAWMILLCAIGIALAAVWIGPPPGPGGA